MRGDKLGGLQVRDFTLADSRQLNGAGGLGAKCVDEQLSEQTDMPLSSIDNLGL